METPKVFCAGLRRHWGMRAMYGLTRRRGTRAMYMCVLWCCFFALCRRGCNKTGTVRQCRSCDGRGMNVYLQPIGPGMVQRVRAKCTDCLGEGMFPFANTVIVCLHHHHHHPLLHSPHIQTQKQRVCCCAAANVNGLLQSLQKVGKNGTLPSEASH